MSDPPVILYHAPPSFYSQLARLALCETGVAYEERVVIPGPPSFETYAPWYLRLNPGGTVPTLQIGEEVIDDSRRILTTLEDRFNGPAPTAEEDGALMRSWIDQAYRLPERELAYGTGARRFLGKRINHLRRRALLAGQRKSTDLHDVYQAKIDDIDSLLAHSQDAAHVASVIERYDAALDELNAHLTGRSFLAGDAYSLADAVWTVSVARQFALGRAPLEGRASLGAWYERMKARPSFDEADVWERLKPSRIARVLVNRVFGRQGPRPAAS